MTDVAAYASIIAPSISQSMDDIMTSHGITFRDLETGAFYLQTQLLQVSLEHSRRQISLKRLKVKW